MLVKLEKRYKRCKLMQWVAFVLSIVFAVAPGFVTAFRVAPAVKGVGPAVGLAGYAAFLVALGVLIVLNSLGKAFAHKLPWALSAMACSWILAFLLICLKDLIAQAVAISVAFALGCSAAFVLSSASVLFKAIAEMTRDEFNRKRDM